MYIFRKCMWDALIDYPKCILCPNTVLFSHEYSLLYTYIQRERERERQSNSSQIPKVTM